MKSLILTATIFMSGYAFSADQALIPTPEAQREFHEKHFVVDFTLEDTGEVEDNKKQTDAFKEFLQKNNFLFEVKEDNDLFVRVIIEPPNEEKYFWLIEHSKEFPINNIFVYTTSDSTIEAIEVDVEKSGSIPLEYVQVILEDRRRLESLIKSVEKAFDKAFEDHPIGIGELGHIASIDVLNDDNIRKYGITVEVRNSQKNFLLLMKTLADFKSAMTIRDVRNPENIFDLEKFKSMAKKKLPITYLDISTDPKLVVVDDPPMSCEGLLIP